VKIEKPGFYRTRNNQRVEVVAVRGGFAVGFCQLCARTWLDDGRHWNYASGAEGSNRNLDILAEWRDPIQQTVTFALVERQCFPEVVLERNIGVSKVLATRTITITEGEGMQ
jgi:hypothetical protein